MCFVEQTIVCAIARLDPLLRTELPVLCLNFLYWIMLYTQFLACTGKGANQLLVVTLALTNSYRHLEFFLQAHADR